MATIKQMLQVAGTLENAELMALQQITDNKPEIWLDLALLLSVQGKATGAKQAQAKYLEKFPNCPRVRFAMSHYAFQDGELEAGFDLLEHGRAINCWGKNSFENINAPLWEGQDLHGKTLLVYSEGGLGDEIIGLRSAHWVKELGAKCVVACSGSLMPVAATSCADAVVDLDRTNAVYHDYWTPGMSAPRTFKRKWETLWPGQYIFNRKSRSTAIWDKIIPKIPGKLNVGLRWSGNPQFEHEQFRRFNPQDLFDATDVPDVIRYSLQKGSSTNVPEGIIDLEPFLTTWDQTVAAMSKLDLVITSCTSIAHVAGALNIPTWVIVPVLSYYTWAKQGDHSDWYPSVKLFRQESFDNWSDPFRAIKTELTDYAKT